MAESPRAHIARPAFKIGVWVFGFFCLVLLLWCKPTQAAPVAASSPVPSASTQAPADRFDHYLQWGLFDSLLLAVDSALTQDPAASATPQRGRWHLLRGAAYAVRQEWPKAKQDFVQAACLKTEARLDSLYVPAAMVRFSDSLRLAVVSQNQACPDFAANQTTRATASMTSNQPSSTDSVAKAAGSVHAASHATWRVAGWVLGDLAALSLLAGAYSQWQAGEAYDRQALAGEQGREEDYAAHGRDVQKHYAIRNASAGGFLIFGIASGYCFWRSTQVPKVAP